MDIRKGGFLAFNIIREQIMQLVNSMPPSAEFGIVLFENGNWGNPGRLVPFRTELLPANVASKEEFFTWLAPINTDASRTGVGSILNQRRWTPKPLPNAGLDTTIQIPDWTRSLHLALEMQPDTVYIITGSQGTLRRRANDT
jgi:hypothetical protein